MKYIKTYHIIKESLTTKDEVLLFMYIREGRGRYMDIRELINNGVNVNCQDGNGYTPLIWAADKGNMIAMIDLINTDADWTIKSNFGNDFIDSLNHIHKEMIINKFPEKYQEYITKKDAEKYNL